jgi:UDP-GlcNAc:undecaprenyl-phosphate GlcNAc-1-phosphate transferase
MAVPGLDMLRVFFERVLNKKNPFKADSNHFHHLLLFKCKKKNSASFFMFFMLLSPYLLTLTKMPNFLVILITLLSYFAILIFLKKKIK